MSILRRNMPELLKLYLYEKCPLDNNIGCVLTNASLSSDILIAMGVSVIGLLLTVVIIILMRVSCPEIGSLGTALMLTS
jgi:hypothetical protein